MLVTNVQRNSYQDSISLMLLTNAINALEGVAKSQIMMGTEANKDIFANAGLLTPEAKAAAPNDMVIVADVADENAAASVLAAVDDFLSDLSIKHDAVDSTSAASSWEEALEALPDANVALFSIPGEYAAPELERALDLGLNVFSFTDNVSMEDEVRLKRKAHEAGLLFMGPDCGTGVISSVPLAFTNVIRPGSIGIVGASGTGIQEVSCMIDRLGEGCMHALGTGGRDLSDEVGAITMIDALAALNRHDPTDVILVISKPPAPKVRDKVMGILQQLSKPVVAVFLGERPEHHIGNVHLAHTLEEAAHMAVALVRGEQIRDGADTLKGNQPEKVLADDQTIVGLYSGGSLAAEAAMLISEALDMGKLVKEEGFMLKTNGYHVIDLGDDVYTQGRPHPMIDPGIRIDLMRRYAADPACGVILFDCVLGYGCHENMAAELAPVIASCIDQARSEGRELHFVGTVVGTELDPQDYRASIETLEKAGALVEDSNAQAVFKALALKGVSCQPCVRDLLPAPDVPVEPLPEPSPSVLSMLDSAPRVINIGVESFCDSIRQAGAEAQHLAWKPQAGGDKHMIDLLTRLSRCSEDIDRKNDEVIERFKESQPYLVDVVPAETVIPELAGRTLLHAGPPIAFEDMTSPMQGACIGAVLFEGWADSEDSALQLLETGAIELMPCHHAHAVGPMTGITSAHMPVLVVENRADGTRAYSTMNEGIGKVLRFGAYSSEVIERLRWMRDVLAPTLSKALALKPEGINLSVLIAKAITMGDEFHQRNIAATLCFLKEITPLITVLDIDTGEKEQVIRFLADTDQFFLNIMMAAGKSIADYARKLKEGCIVTAMCRNGREFGIRISGMGDRWFCAPANTPDGLYFTGYSPEDANPDIGDSAITETVGVGAMAMIAAPGVTRFVGAGGFEDALAISNEMEKICVAHNPTWSIPTWDFKGTCLGIDIRKVVASGITPLINTGIAHRKAGIGQIGAGTVRAPLGCFTQGLEAYCRSLGIE